MKKLMTLLIAALLLLSACGNNENTGANNDSGGHEGMNHSSSGEVPAGLEDAANPKFPVGSEAVIAADHMEGMDGATATIVGAYNTTVYTISYIPTTGGERVTNHKWVIHQELKDAGEDPYQAGDTVVIEANHMEGMEGATAEINSAEQTTVYMVDYMPTTGGEKVTNHKWLTESELIPE